MANPNPGRHYPDMNASRFADPWVNIANLTNMDWHYVTGTLTIPTAATTTFCGGLIIPANKTITNAVIFPTTTGASYTIKHFALLDITRTVRAVTTNSTTALTANAMNAIPFGATYTPTVDTLAYLAISIAATTAPTLMASPVGQATWFASGNVKSGNSSTTPTSTPPALSAVLGAPASGLTQIVWAGLS